MLRERVQLEVTPVPEKFPIFEVVLGIAGAIAVAVGAWMYFVPATWFLGGFAEAWYLGLIGGGGVLVAGAFGFSARRILGRESRWSSPAVLRTVLALGALALTFVAVALLII